MATTNVLRPDAKHEKNVILTIFFKNRPDHKARNLQFMWQMMPFIVIFNEKSIKNEPGILIIVHYFFFDYNPHYLHETWHSKIQLKTVQLLYMGTSMLF